MKITVKERNYGLVEFYETVAKKMGYVNTDNLQYDCTKINIANNIQDGFYEYYKGEVKPEYKDLPESEIRVSITMLLAMSGPKVDNDLKDNEVEVFNGFVKEV